VLEPLQLITAAILPGYIFINTSTAKKYKTPYYPGSMLYTTLIFYGLVFSIAAVLLSPYIAYCLKALLPAFIEIHLLETHVNYLTLMNQIFLISIASILSYGSGKARSFYLKHFDKIYNLTFLKEHGSELQVMAMNVMLENITKQDEDLYIELRLKNDKVYIGLPADFPEPIKPNSDEYFYILPMYSGYRTSFDHSLCIKTKYIDLYEEAKANGNLNMNDFSVMIDAKEIVTARRFDPKLYFDRFEH
jgi:hypothetical protein